MSACWSSDKRSKAASVGMKMVKGPGPLRVSTRPATDSSPLTYLLYACSALAVSKMFAMRCFSFFSSKLHLRGCGQTSLSWEPCSWARTCTRTNCPVYWSAPDHVITNGTAPEYLHSLIGAREEKRGKRRETFSYQWESVRGPITIST